MESEDNENSGDVYFRINNKNKDNISHNKWTSTVCTFTQVGLVEDKENKSDNNVGCNYSVTPICNFNNLINDETDSLKEKDIILSSQRTRNILLTEDSVKDSVINYDTFYCKYPKIPYVFPSVKFIEDNREQWTIQKLQYFADRMKGDSSKNLGV